MTSVELKEYINEHESIPYILEQIGCHSIEFHPGKNYYSSCFPDGDNRMGVIIKCSEYLNYYSYSRGIDVEEGKDIFCLIQDVKKMSFAETMKYVHSLFGLKYTFKKQIEPEEPKADPLAIFKRVKSKYKIKNIADFQVYDESILDDFVPMIHIDLFREGIMPWTIKKFGLGYSYKWKRTIFPHRYWLTGELLGFNARTSIENYKEFDIKKYFLTPNMPKEINLYGLWENREDIEKKKYIVIGEAEKSVCKRDSKGDSTWVAISGHSLSSEQVRIISGLDIDEIVIALDKDVPIEEIRAMCEKFYHVRKVSYIWDKWDLLKGKDSPADAPNKIYDFLFKYRVVYDETEHKEYEKSLKKGKK